MSAPTPLELTTSAAAREKTTLLRQVGCPLKDMFGSAAGSIVMRHDNSWAYRA